MERNGGTRKPTGAGPGADDAEKPRESATGPRIDPGLHVVATPIGNARDVTLRGLDVLRGADVIAAEDTRTARRLMDLHGVALGGRPLIAYHDHNGAERRPEILRLLEEGRSVALVSEAGTPMISDPGYKLARAAAEAGHEVRARAGRQRADRGALRRRPANRPVPLRGLPDAEGAGAAEGDGRTRRDPGDAGVLRGAPPPRRVAGRHGGRAGGGSGGRGLPRADQAVRGGAARHARRAGRRHAEEAPPKGEVVVVVGPPSAPPAEAAAGDLDAALRAALRDGSLKDAVRAVTEATGAPRRVVYARALEIADDETGRS